MVASAKERAFRDSLSFFAADMMKLPICAKSSNLKTIILCDVLQGATLIFLFLFSY